MFGDVSDRVLEIFDNRTVETIAGKGDRIS